LGRLRRAKTESVQDRPLKRQDVCTLEPTACCGLGHSNSSAVAIATASSCDGAGEIES